MTDPFETGSRRPDAPEPATWAQPGWTPTPPQLAASAEPAAFSAPEQRTAWYPRPTPVAPASVGWAPPPPTTAQHASSTSGVARFLALLVALVVVFAVGFAAGGTTDPTTGLGAGAGAGSSATPGGSGTTGVTPSTPAGAPSDFGVFWEALKVVQDNFVDPSRASDQTLTWGAIRGMVAALGDTGHSIFLTPDEVQAENQSLNGHVSGIGVVVDSRNAPPTIVSVIPNSPAAAAGLKKGDVIVAVDGTSTDALQSSDIVTRIRGQAGTTVTLTVRHVGDTTTVDVSIVRADVAVPASSWAMIPGTQIADVHVQQFSSQAGQAAKADIQSALDAGAQKIVLDLRGNPGGYVNEAVTLASQFLAEGTTVYQEKDRAGTVTPDKAQGGGIALNVPLVVLIDQGSASAAEIVSGGIQGNGRAKLVGAKTFGTGTVLNTYTLSDGSAVRLGVLEWLTPTGETIFGKGITPDVPVELPTDGTVIEPSQLQSMAAADFTASKDTQLRKAVELLGS